MNVRQLRRLGLWSATDGALVVIAGLLHEQWLAKNPFANNLASALAAFLIGVPISIFLLTDKMSYTLASERQRQDELKEAQSEVAFSLAALDAMLAGSEYRGTHRVEKIRHASEDMSWGTTSHLNVISVFLHQLAHGKQALFEGRFSHLSRATALDIVSQCEAKAKKLDVLLPPVSRLIAVIQRYDWERLLPRSHEIVRSALDELARVRLGLSRDVTAPGRLKEAILEFPEESDLDSGPVPSVEAAHRATSAIDDLLRPRSIWPSGLDLLRLPQGLQVLE